MLNFWATYCGPCKLEMPWFQDLENKYKGQGLVVLGLDQDDGMAVKEIAAASKRVGVTYPILMPDDKVSKSYQLSDYIPETFYVDKSGKIVRANDRRATRRTSSRPMSKRQLARVVYEDGADRVVRCRCLFAGSRPGDSLG